MNNNEVINVYMEEYRQLNEFTRHDDKITASKESIFAIIPLGILAYTAGRELSFPQLLVAAFASISIYMYCVFSCERMAFYSRLRFKRLREIESSIKELFGSEILRFHTHWKEYEDNIKSETKKSRHWYHWFNPHIWIESLAESIGIRVIRMVMILILIGLWLIIIIN